MKSYHQICFICKIVGGDSFPAAPPKSIFSMQFVFFVSQKKSRNILCLEPHDTYILFRAVFSHVNIKWFFFFRCPIPLMKISYLLIVWNNFPKYQENHASSFWDMSQSMCIIVVRRYRHRGPWEGGVHRLDCYLFRKINEKITRTVPILK